MTLKHMEQYKEQFIEFLVKSNALKFGEFTLKSGRVAPYFINTGEFDDGEKIARLGHFYASALQDKDVEFDIIFGPAYKGIPLAISASIAWQTEFKKNAGYTFNRKEAKDHGDKGVFVGKEIKPGHRVVIVDDVMTSGQAMRESFALLGPVKPVVCQILVSVDRMERGQESVKSALQEISEEFNVPVSAIATVKEILEHLYNRQLDGRVYINDEQKKSIENYLEEYGAK